MQLHFYQPVLWRGAEGLRVLTGDSSISEYDAALLIRMRRATWVAAPIHSPFTVGAIMSDDTSSALQLVMPPASEPLTLVQAKAFLRIENTADDDAITRAITVARQFAEHYLRELLLPQTWSFAVANLLDCHVRLPVGPAQAITSVTLTDTRGNATAMASANYRLSVDGFTVILNNVPNAEKLTVVFTAGRYADAAAVPGPILQGMLHHISVMMETRDGAAALPVQSVNCYQPYRRVSL